jgi:hypothetical protein
MSSSHRVAFINGDGKVLTVIQGELSRSDYLFHLSEAHAAYGAAWGIEVADPTVKIWIGGFYDNDLGFIHYDPSVVDSTSEVIEEGTTNERE